MDCCQPEVIQERFDDQYVRRKLKRYQTKGAKETTRLLVEAISKHLMPGMTLIDIGGGIGDIEHELLKLGVSHATNVEASKSYLQACMQEAARLGQLDRMSFVEDDFVAAKGRLEPAEIVTLDRVICCYPFMHELVDASLEASKQLYGIVVPLDRWWVKLFTTVYHNLRFFIKGIDFRVFIHPISEIEDLIYRKGFERTYFTEKSGWHIALYQRAT